MMNLAVPHRTNPRRRTILRLESGKHERERVLNLSQTGMFIQGTDLVDANKGVIWIPGDEKPLELKFRATFPRNGGTGVLFDAQDRHTRQELQAYVTHQREQERLQRMEQRLNDGKPANLKPMNEDLGTRNVLRPLEKSGSPIGVYRKIDGVALGARIAAVDPLNARMSLLLDTPNRAGQEIPHEFDEVFLALKQGDVTYLADTVVERTSGVLSSIMLPERVFLPERRAMDREYSQGAVLRVEVAGRTIVGQVMQLDANGFGVLFPASDAADLRKAGTLRGAVLCRADGDTALETLRVAWHSASQDGLVRFGLQRDIPRSPVDRERRVFDYVPPGRIAQAWLGMSMVLGGLLERVGVSSGVVEPTAVVISDERGRPLSALVNASFPMDRVPRGPINVVLIPPPYGRRKEMPCGLALILVESFRAANENVVVIRWDGANHVGESWRDQQSHGTDHPMLRYTQSQAVIDLGLVVGYVRTQFPDRELRTVAVSFSLAAVAVRRYLASGAPGIDYWIAPMGAADARDTIRNGNGGVDLVGERKRGVTLGVCLIQGQLVDADHHCDDLIKSGMADLEDSRRDMAVISQPVTWLCGQHDYWVNARRVADVMTVPAPGTRELLEVPTGHFVRTSNDALATFRIIAERAVRHLAGKNIPARTPSPFVLKRTAEIERGRLKSKPFDAAAYWKEYLIGNRTNPLGFDLLALTDEYADLMQTQMDLLAPEPKWRIADLGCGTGNALAAMTRNFAATVPGLEIEAIDLVPEALERARRNVAAACAEGRIKGLPIRYQVADLALTDRPNLPYADSSFNAILLSLVVPYLADPRPLLQEVQRILKPGGRLVISTLRPDVDMSRSIARLREKLECGDTQLIEGWTAPRLVAALRDYINRAASLLDHEVDGRFHFHEQAEFEDVLRSSGLRVLRTVPAFGEPALALVSVAEKPDG